MTRFICIHGHFYQPPRENPWLEAVEVQDSAYPYHDWNERITTECYAANASSRILDAAGRIDRIANNYARISFDFGPTLLSWLEANAPDTYRAVLAADDESARRFSGHGSAMAQAYNHVILPLASRADKVTQVRWGMRDFEHRFRRRAEGMWLPETAVDVETLEVLATERVAFTVLAPHQAARVRRVGGREWTDVSGGRVDPTQAYLARLPSGRSIVLFFYDGPVSRAVAFERLLDRGEDLVRRIAGTFDDRRGRAQLAHIATDGETYGHHHRFGDMALAFALDHVERQGIARLTNYGEFLALHPPTHEVEILPGTSWSCAHGIERWRSDCGCNSGGHPSWRQAWRGPLRAAFDWLRDTLAERAVAEGRGLFLDPAAARDDYVSVVLDRSAAAVDTFLRRHAHHPLSADERVRALKLLEMQRHLMLMYTSCGWFFDEVSGIETVQVLQYAGRAVQLAQQLFGDGVESRFLALLEQAPSNRAEYGNARAVFERTVRPSMVGLEQVAAHVAVSSLFDAYGDRARVYCYEVERRDRRVQEAGRLRLATERLTITSTITGDHADVACAVVHFGDHNLSCGVRPYDEAAYRVMVRDLGAAFSRADVPEVIRLVDRHFVGPTYSLRSLFRDEQRRILDIILETTLREAEAEVGRLFDHHAPLMHFLASLGAPLPRAFRGAAEQVLNRRLRDELEGERIDLERTRSLLNQATEYKVTLDAAGLTYAMQRHLERLAAELGERPADLELLRRLAGATGVAAVPPFDVNLWRVQNAVYTLRETAYAERRGLAAEAEWRESFEILCELLHIRIV
ncbi:MAG: DUF3536 domain-containing protein [Acidobacteria bacterium]|nr:DUF3536 domain-containing protein [Acidobacteriota bacterium]